MKLAENQRRHLRGLAHSLKPVVMIGNSGLTDAVVAETQRALQDHELIKLKVRAGDREVRDTLVQTLGARTESSVVTRIGNVAVLYRARAGSPRILLPAPAGALTQTEQ